MAKKPVTAEKPPETPVDPAAELRGKLVRRLAVAGITVAILLGVLTLFDRLATPPEGEDVPVFTRPVPVGAQKEISQPVTPATNLPEPPPPPPETPPADVATTPVAAPAEARDAPPPPAPAAVPTLTAPAVPSPTMSTPTAPVPAAATPVAPAPVVPAPVVRPAAPSPSATIKPVPPVKSAPLAPSTAARPAAPVRPAPPPLAEETAPPPMQPEAPSAQVIRIPARSAPAAPPRLFSGFVLQAGVFSSPQLAEELHAKLALSGVPTSLETRVQVGPFKTRDEAERAQRKLHELGVETVLVPPKGRR